MLDWLRSKPPMTPVPPSADANKVQEILAHLTRMQAQADEAATAARALKAELDLLRAESGDTSEALKKLARSFGRTSLRVEEIERKLDAGVQSTGAASVTPPERDLAALFDALDLLDRAVESLDRAAAPELAAGLDGVHARLVRHLNAEGFTRVASRGAAPDGTLVRVVGTIETSEAVDGLVVGVVRAAIKSGDRVVREGEVITARSIIPIASNE